MEDKYKPCNRAPKGSGFTLLEVMVALIISFLMVIPLLGELGSLHGLWRRTRRRACLSDVAFRIMGEILMPQNRKVLTSLADNDEWITLDAGLEGIVAQLKVEKKPVIPGLGEKARDYCMHVVRLRVKDKKPGRVFTVESGIPGR